MFLSRLFYAGTLWLAASVPCFAQSPPPSTGSRADAAKARTSVASQNPLALQRTFAEWKAACAKLPSNRKLNGRLPSKELLPLPSFRDFDEVLSALFAQCKSGTLADTNLWVGKLPAAGSFFNTGAAYFLKSEAPSSVPAIPFEPFAEKRVLPEGSEVFFHADLHGDIRSLLATLSRLNEDGYLRGFEVARTNFHMIFLGDYTDRGAYGVEVLYTLLRLKLANPENVFLLRGNHEDVSLQQNYGFLDEGLAKYGASFDAVKLLRAYDFLPVVLYLGCGSDFIQCNHGGLEPGFRPGPLLEPDTATSFRFLGPLRQRQYFNQHPEWFAHADKTSRDSAPGSLMDFLPTAPTSPHVIGFMWNDFSLIATEPQFAVVENRGVAYGPKATELFLENAGTATKHLRAIFRGHQQYRILNPMMRRLLASRGVFRHWQAADSARLLAATVGELSQVLEHGDERSVPQGSLWTFNVSPDSVYGEACAYNFDAFGILKLSRDFADWRLRVVNVTVAE